MRPSSQSRVSRNDTSVHSSHLVLVQWSAACIITGWDEYPNDAAVIISVAGLASVPQAISF